MSDERFGSIVDAVADGLKSEVRITSFSLVEEALKGHPERSATLGHFDFECRGFRFSGCTLFRTIKYGFAVAMPRVDRSVSRPPKILDDQLRHAIITAALKVYADFGGRWADWAPEGSDARAEFEAWLGN